ncbi:GyrI-like domain-containing protein [Enterococcus sp. LJL98]
MDYQIKIQALPDTQVISFRYTGQYKEMGEYFKLLFELAKERINGAPFSLYYDSHYQEEADIEVCLPVSEEIGVSAPFQNKIIAGGEFVTTLHQGDYTKLPLGYQAIEDYLSLRNIPIGTPSREIYLEAFSLIDYKKTSQACTQIAIPLPLPDEN